MQYTIDSPVADIQWVGKDKKVFVWDMHTGCIVAKTGALATVRYAGAADALGPGAWGPAGCPQALLGRFPIQL